MINTTCDNDEQLKEVLEQNLKFAVWDRMEFLSEYMQIDDPVKVIDIIRESIDECIRKYPLTYDHFRIKNYDTKDRFELAIEKHGIKLKFAITHKIKILGEYFGIDNLIVIDKISKVVDQSILEYSPTYESFEGYEY